MAIENEDQVSVLEGGNGRETTPKTPEVSALLRVPTTAADIAKRIGTGKTIQERSRLAREEMPGIMAEQSKAELDAARAQELVARAGLEQQAKAEKEVLGRARSAVDAVDRETKRYQEFVQPEYKASDYAANAAARLFTGLMLGGVAKMSAIGQLQAIRDMQKAEDQGLREQFTAARIKFEESEKARKDFNSNIKDRFDRLMKLLPYDRNAALAEAKIIEAGLKDGAIVAAMKAGDYGKANNLVQKFMDQGDKVETARIAAQVKAELRPAGGPFAAPQTQASQVPVLPPNRNPYAGLNQKAANDVFKAEVESFTKARDKARQQETKTNETLSDLDKAENSLAKIKTGGLYGMPGVGTVAQTVASATDKDVSDFDTVSTEMQRNSYVPGEGQVSNYERQLFQRQTISLARPKETNQRIINSFRAAAQNTRDYNQFMEEYFAVNKTMNGAQEYWNQYISKNPVIIENKDGTISQNPNRVTYRDFFAGVTTAATAQTPSPESAAEGGVDVGRLRQQAMQAIAAGKDRQAVSRRFKSMTGQDL